MTQTTTLLLSIELFNVLPEILQATEHHRRLCQMNV